MAKKDNKQLVINQIVVKAPQRRSYDVGQWRKAIKSADAGRVRYLYDLFDDILIDGLLSDAIEKRIEAVLNTGLTFIDAQGEPIPEIVDMLDSSAGERLLRGILQTKFYGRSGVEVDFKDGFQCAVIPPKYIDLDNHRIITDAIGEDSTSYEGVESLLILGSRFDYGLLLKAAPFAIYKRGGFGDYAQWIELFGMPQRVGKYSTYDPEGRKLLEEAFEKAGSAPWLVIPKESEVETKESASGSGTSYDEFRKACNEEILITILGQTLTTIQGDKGARSLGEVHMEVESSKHDSDIRFVEKVLNERFVPILEARGFSIKGGRFIFPQRAESLSVDEIVKLSDIIPIPTSYIFEKYGIPQAKDGEEVAKRQSTEVIEIEEETGKGKKKENIRNSDGRGWFQRMIDFFVIAPQVGAMNGTALTLADAKTLDERIIARTPNTAGFDTELFEYFSKDLIKAFRTGWESTTLADLAIDYAIQDDALKTAMEMNLYRFSAAKTLAEVQALNQLFRESSSYSEFQKSAKQICEKFNKRWQRTEFDTAQLSAQSASRYQQLIRKQEKFPYWEYRIIRDGRVRPSHRKLDGIVLPAGDKRWDKIFPPNDWNCRCRVKPLLKKEFNGSVEEMRQRVDEYLNSDDWTRAHANGWGVNRAKEGLVFTENQFYVNMLSKGNQRILERLNHADYGLPTIEECLKVATEEMPIYEGTAEEWYKEHNVLTDYIGRKIVVPAKAFVKHTTKSKYLKQERISMLNAVKDILKNPDEIWIKDRSRNSYDVNFIKFYNGKVINVVCLVDNLSYEVLTWFEIVSNEKTRHQYRRGLLVKK